ncbi:MAG: PP2C family protein-serine/threonine phosphatase [Pseudomonadota bacterium]
MVAFAGKTHPGRVRAHNEDVVGWDPERGIYLVADGMGGHASGEVASRIVCDTLLAEGPGDSLEAAIVQAHQAISRAAEADGGLGGMGSTVVALRLDGPIGHFAWVGDSRAYLWRRRSISRITRDHSFIEMLREREDMSESDLRNHPNRNIVTQTLGLGDPTPSSVDVALKRGDWIVLCSDGLNDELTDEQIATVLEAHAEPQAAVQALIDGALAKGGRDNVSVVVVAYHGEGQGPWWRRLLPRRRDRNDKEQ